MKHISKKYFVPKSRIPIAFLIDYIKKGLTISDFLASYPWLKRKDIERALDQIKKKEFSAPHAA